VIIDEQAQGFRIVGLENDEIEVRVIPQLGGKICGLRDRSAARDWMWLPPGPIQLFANRTGDAFADSTLIGADECLPTIAACRWRNRELTDHGEAWTEAWSLDEDALIDQRIVTRLRLPISSLEIERTIQLQGNRVQLNYELWNIGNESLEYLWALHPMMAITDGDQLVLPSECSRVRLDATVINCNLGGRGQSVRYPEPAPEVNLELLKFGRAAAAVKFFTEPLSIGCAGLRNKHSGEYIVFSVDPQELNTFGVWINRGGWSNFHHVAIEPTNGAPDPLELAVDEWRRFSSLLPGESRHWELNIFLGTDHISDHISDTEEFLSQFAVSRLK
jgi:hypothetical protein